MAEDNGNTEKEKSGFDFKIIIAGLLIFLIAMGASYFLMKSLMAPLLPKTEEKTEETTAVSGGLVSAGVFTTNIGASAGNRYLKVEVSLEVSDEKNAEAETSKEYMPIVRDTIITILSSKSVEDLDDRNAVKEDIKIGLNKKLGKDFIKNVYFTDFILQ